MNILELDEAQGLTTEMVQTWAEAKGWKYRLSGLQVPDGGIVVFTDPRRPGTLGRTLELIAEHYDRSPQSLLREINPRMRPWPSDAARFAHRGFWIAIDPKDYNAVMGRFEKPWFRHSDNLVVTEDMGIMFWPCDVHAQRVRWPTDEQGNML